MTTTSNGILRRRARSRSRASHCAWACLGICSSSFQPPRASPSRSLSFSRRSSRLTCPPISRRREPSAVPNHQTSAPLQTLSVRLPFRAAEWWAACMCHRPKVAQLSGGHKPSTRTAVHVTDSRHPVRCARAVCLRGPWCLVVRSHELSVTQRPDDVTCHAARWPSCRVVQA